jgi:hypothetical protein
MMAYNYDRGAATRPKKFKIEHVEFVRSDTYKVSVDLGKEGRIRIVVYPGNKMQVLSDGPLQWLQDDLSSAQQKQIVKAIEDFKKQGR